MTFVGVFQEFLSSMICPRSHVGMSTFSHEGNHFVMHELPEVLHSIIVLPVDIHLSLRFRIIAFVMRILGRIGGVHRRRRGRGHNTYKSKSHGKSAICVDKPLRIPKSMNVYFLAYIKNKIGSLEPQSLSSSSFSSLW